LFIWREKAKEDTPHYKTHLPPKVYFIMRH